MANFTGSIDAAMSGIVDQPQVSNEQAQIDAIENARSIGTNHIQSFEVEQPEISRFVPEIVEVDEDAEYAVWLWNLWLAVETDTNPITCSEWLRSFHEPENPDVIKSIKRQMERKRIAKRVYFGRLLEQKRIADAETRKEQAAKAAVLEDIVAELELAKQVLDVEAKMVHEADRKARKAAKAVAAAEAERKAAKAAKFAEERATAMARIALHQRRDPEVVEEPARVARVEENRDALEKAARVARHAAKTQERERAAEALRVAAETADAAAAAKAQHKAALAEQALIRREEEAAARRDAAAAAKMARANQLKEAQAKADEEKRHLKLADSLSRRVDHRHRRELKKAQLDLEKQQVVVTNARAENDAIMAEHEQQRRVVERIRAQRDAIVAEHEQQRRVFEAARAEETRQRRAVKAQRAVVARMAAEHEAAMAESMAMCSICFLRFDDTRRIAMYSKCGPTEHKCVMCLECLLQLAPPTRCICGRDDLAKIKWSRL